MIRDSLHLDYLMAVGCRVIILASIDNRACRGKITTKVNMVLTLAPPAWMLQRLPMSSVHLLRFETSAASGPERLSEVNFWLALAGPGVF